MIRRIREAIERTDAGVFYLVLVNNQIVWSKYVAFGQDKAHRAGGSAFVAAAREQDEENDRQTSAKRP